MKNTIIAVLCFMYVNSYAQEAIKDPSTGKWYFEKETAEGMKKINHTMYDDFIDFYSDYGAVMLEGKWYIIDRNIKIKRGPFDYIDREGFQAYGEAIVKRNGMWNVVTYKNKLVLKHDVPDSNFLCCADGPFYLSKVGSKIYFANVYKKRWEDITCRVVGSTPGEGNYEECKIEDYIFLDAMGYAVVRKEKFSMIDKRGNLKIPFTYSYISGFNSSFTSVVSEYKWYGYIDSSFKLFIPCVYEYAAPFVGSAASVKQQGLYGIINKSQKILVPLQYQSLTCIDQNGLLYSAEKNKKFGVIDTNNRVCIPMIYDGEFSCVNSNCYITKIGDYYGMINMIQRKLVPFEYSSFNLTLSAKNLVIFKHKSETKNPYYIFNSFGDKRNDEGYETIYYFDGERCKVKRNGKYGYIDASGYEVIPCQYDEVGYFIAGAVEVKKDGKKFKIDINGQKVIDTKP